MLEIEILLGTMQYRRTRDKYKSIKMQITEHELNENNVCEINFVVR